jgi:hypothetical protein
MISFHKIFLLMFRLVQNSPSGAGRHSPNCVRRLNRRSRNARTQYQHAVISPTARLRFGNDGGVLHLHFVARLRQRQCRWHIPARYSSPTIRSSIVSRRSRYQPATRQCIPVQHRPVAARHKHGQLPSGHPDLTDIRHLVAHMKMEQFQAILHLRCAIIERCQHFRHRKTKLER